jgi:hypothetical protein
MRANRNNAALAGLALAWCLSAPALYAQAQKPFFQEWSVLVLEDKQCGFASTITTKKDTATGPQYTTVDVQEFVVKRLDASLKITETSKVTEDADGAVLGFEETSSSFGSDVTSTGVRDGDDLVVSSRGQTQRYHIPRLDALGPEKIRELSDAVPHKAGQEFSFKTFASEYPQAAVTETGTVVAQENRDVRGTQRKLWKLTSTMSMMPGVVSTIWIDDQNNDVEAVTAMPGIGDLHEYVTDRAECMKQPEGAEIFAPTLLHPDHAIPSPETLSKAVYRLTLSDPTKTFTLWNQGEQKILSTNPGSVQIEVTDQNLPPSAATWQLPHADTPELHPFLQASTYLEVNSPEIQALAKEAVGNEKNPVVAAHKIENFVRIYIDKKDLNVGFASAQETARSREGDCTEHAVLCAAIARAAGLPSRCVVGFGYIPPGVEADALTNEVDSETGIFGFHMWAEAWIGPDQWVPMDAALNGFDVGHIAIAKSALEEINPLIDLNTPVLNLMQDLKIEVEKTVPKNPGTSTSAAPKPASID